MYQFRTPVGAPEPPDQLPEDEPFDDGPLKTAKTGVIHALLVLLAVIVFTAGYIGWEHQQTGQVVAQQPIGALIRMTGAGGRIWPLVIETQLGFFPLRKAISIPRGTALMVEERASGKRFVCNLGRTLCVQTSAASLTEREQAD